MNIIASQKNPVNTENPSNNSNSPDYERKCYSNTNATNAQNAQLLTHLWRGGDWGNFWTPNAGATLDKKNSRFIPTSRPFAPLDWIASKNLYFGVNPCVSKREYFERSINAEIAAINCLYAEFDGKDETTPTDEQIKAHFDRIMAAGAKSAQSAQREALGKAKKDVYNSAPAIYKGLAFARIDALPVRPSVIVASGGGYQCYWLLAETFSFAGDAAHVRRWAETIQDRWVSFAGADDSAKDLARVLRLPGSKNRKPEYGPDFPTVEYVTADFDRLYTLDALLSYLPALSYPEPTTRQYAKRQNVTVERTQRDDSLPSAGKMSRYAYRVLMAYNEQHDIVSTLESYGYEKGQNERLRRPGGATESVWINDNRSFHHSGSDPLQSEKMHSPFDVVTLLDFGGDYEKAAKHFGPALGVIDPAVIASLRSYILTADIGQHVPDEMKRRRVTVREVDSDGVITYREDWTTRYSTRSTDMVILDRILEIVAAAGRCPVRVNAYQVVRGINTDNQVVQIKTHKTVAAVLARHGWLFDAVPADKPNTWDLSLKVDLSRIPVTNDLGDYDTGNLLKSTFVHWKNDDQFAGGTSRFVRQRVDLELRERLSAAIVGAFPDDKAQAQAVEIFDTIQRWGACTAAEIADALSLDVKAVESALGLLMGLGLGLSLDAGQYTCISLEEQTKAALDALPAGLQAAGILVIHSLTLFGGSGGTQREIASEHGLAPSNVGAILRKLRGLGLVESHRRHMAESIHFIDPDAFQKLYAMRPALRTFNGHLCRHERTLENTQNALQRRCNAQREAGEDTTALAAKITRIAERRRPALVALYPGLTPEAVTRWIYGAYTPERQQVKAPAMTPFQYAPEVVKEDGMSIFDAYAELAAAELAGAVTVAKSSFGALPMYDLTAATRKLAL